MAFIVEEFIESCRQAVKESESQTAIGELVKRAIADPKSIINALGEPRQAGVETLYNDDDLTILNIVWAPKMTLHPHNHCMWADIGIYGGSEENNFFHRTDQGLIQQGQAILSEKDMVPLHPDVIHSVHNPGSRLTAALHIYGGNFFTAPRSEWDSETLEEQPYDVEHLRAVFAEANEKLLAEQNAG